MKKWLFLLCIIPLLSLFFISRERPLPSGCDIVVFSYDRPMQLYAFLQSLFSHTNDAKSIVVLYRSSKEDYAKGYLLVEKDFPTVHFVKQPNDPVSFKPIFLEILKNKTPSSHIGFAVDDIIVTDSFSFKEILSAMEEFQAHGFYLRLGSNITYSYMENISTPPPPLKEWKKGIFFFRFLEGKGDWGYPQSLDMTIFPKQQVLSDIEKLSFTNPNQLESSWSKKNHAHKRGLCFQRSKIVNIPVNLVQTSWKNRNMGSYCPQELLDLFFQGAKIDIRPFVKIDNPSAHIEKELSFVTVN